MDYIIKIAQRPDTNEYKRLLILICNYIFVFW